LQQALQPNTLGLKVKRNLRFRCIGLRHMRRFLLSRQDVAVVGGGDTACEEATYLAGLCKKVYMIVRKNYLRASKAMQSRV